MYGPTKNIEKIKARSIIRGSYKSSLDKNGISLMINNYNELSKNLISDLKNPNKQNKKNSTLMNKLGKKTFSDTMILINNFLNNKYE